MSNESEILESWDQNAARWVDAIEQRRIGSRRYTDEAMVGRVLKIAPRRVLDVGCGEGWLVRRLNGLGIEAWGVDGSQELIAAAKARGSGEFSVATYDEIARLRGAYDVIVFNFSLIGESVATVLRAAKTRLAGNGRIVIQMLHPMNAVEGQYRSGWRVETFESLAGSGWAAMRRFFRTLEDWIAAIREAGLMIESLGEPRDAESGRVLSVIFELTA